MNGETRLTSRVQVLLSTLSLIAAFILLMASQFASPQWHAWLSSLPLALAGAGYAFLQIRLKPPLSLLWKRLMLAGAFLLWAVVQLLGPGRFAAFLGDVVIAAYVVDLFWIMQDRRE